MADKNYLQLEDGIGFVGLVDSMKEHALLKTVNAARISYGKRKTELDKKDHKLINFLAEHEHTSPFRHSHFTFHIKLPLFVARQWMKYQVSSTWRTFEADGNDTGVSMEAFDHFYDLDKGCSWNEVSGRYVEWTPEFYVPMVMRSNAGHGNKQASSDLPEDFDHRTYREEMLEECHLAYAKYLTRLESGVAKEIARMTLPQNLYTEVYWTCSLQSLQHFIKQRTHEDAQYEIRQYALMIERLLEQELCP